MATEIIQQRAYGGPINVWYCADSQYPSVSMGSGVFAACLNPYQARELAHALIEAANAATARPVLGEVS